MKEIVRIIRDVELYSHNVIASILEDGVVSKTLISGNEIVHSAGELGFMKAHIKDFADIRRTGVYEMDGRQVYCEVLEAVPELVVCGAGHVGLACVKAGKLIEMKVSCYEDRSEFAELARQAGADAVIEGNVAENLKSLKGGSDMYIVSMMRAHALDQMNLEILLPLESAYIGMLGSSKKLNAIKTNLDAKGFDLSLFDKLHTPIGMDINAQSPEEIAIAIIGEIIQIKNAECTSSKAFSDEQIEAIADSNEAKMLITLVRKDAASPREPGTKMIVKGDGSKIGTIGGGLAEAQAIRFAGEKLSDESFVNQLLKVGENDSRNTGMVCGGVMDVLVERIG